MSAPDLQENIQKAVAGLQRLYTRTLPVKVGTKAVALTRQRFSQSAYNGKQWKEPYRRKLSFKGTTGRYGTLLSGTNHLRDSTYFKPEPGKVYIRNQVEYGAIHNYGGTITVTAKMKRYFWYRHAEAKGRRLTKKKGGLRQSRGNEALTREAEFWRNMALKKVGSIIRMPQRRFFGSDPNMEKELRKIIDTELQRFIKQYGEHFRTSR